MAASMAVLHNLTKQLQSEFLFFLQQRVQNDCMPHGSSFTNTSAFSVPSV